MEIPYTAKEIEKLLQTYCPDAKDYVEEDDFINFLEVVLQQYKEQQRKPRIVVEGKSCTPWKPPSVGAVRVRISIKNVLIDCELR